MNFSWNTVGHPEAKKYLERFIASPHREHHAHLFLGQKGIGKKTLAREAAELLLCTHPETRPCGSCVSCRSIAAGTHPDVFTISVPEGKTQIPVENIQDIIRAISTTSFLKTYKVILLYDCESLSLSAANALLKTMEEPPAGTFFFCTASSEQRVLATIRSRCVNLRLFPLPKEIVTAYLERIAPGRELNSILAHASHGVIGTIVPFLQSDDAWQECIREYREFSQTLFGSLQQKMLFYKEGEANQIFSKLLSSYHEALLSSFDLPEYLQYPTERDILPKLTDAHIQRLVAKMEILLKTFQWSKENVNPKLLLDTIFLTV